MRYLLHVKCDKSEAMAANPMGSLQGIWCKTLQNCSHVQLDKIVNKNLSVNAPERASNRSHGGSSKSSLNKRFRVRHQHSAHGISCPVSNDHASLEREMKKPKK